MLFFLTRFKVAVYSIFTQCRGTCSFGQKGLSSNPSKTAARPSGRNYVDNFLVVGIYHTLLKEVVGGDMACQVGKAYNIFPSASWSLNLDAITRSRQFFEFDLVPFGRSWRN